MKGATAQWKAWQLRKSLNPAEIAGRLISCYHDLVVDCLYYEIELSFSGSRDSGVSQGI